MAWFVHQYMLGIFLESVKAIQSCDGVSHSYPPLAFVQRHWWGGPKGWTGLRESSAAGRSGRSPGGSCEKRLLEASIVPFVATLTGRPALAEKRSQGHRGASQTSVHPPEVACQGSGRLRAILWFLGFPNWHEETKGFTVLESTEQAMVLGEYF